jgi:quinol monooxygenase YgiN
MAIVVIDQAPGVTAEQFEALAQKFDESTNLPSGLNVRIAGPVEGGWRVISVWESQEAYEAFRRNQFTPVIQQMGITAKDQLQIAPLHSLMIRPQQR